MRSKILAVSQCKINSRLLVLCLVAFMVSCQSVKSGKVSVLVGDKELWHATEAGASWQSKRGPGEGYIESLTKDLHDQRRLLLCRGGIVWMSKNEGRSWGSAIFKTVEEQGVAATFHPTKPNTLLLATNRRFLISTNGGKDWTAASPGLEFKWRPLTILVSDMKADRVYVMTRGDGVYRSDDGGNHWMATNSNLPKGIGAAPVAPIESTVLNPKNPDLVYIAVEARGIYKTVDGGANWIRVSQGLPDTIMYRTFPWILAIDPMNPQRLIVWASWPVHSDRIDSAFFLSEDGSTSWNKIAADPAQGRVFAVQFVDAKVGLAVAITEGGAMVLSNR